MVSPLIALMADQWRRLATEGHPAVMIASGLGERAGARVPSRRIRGGAARIVYCSPERFGSPAFLDAVSSRRVDLMAVDEAHCLSEWGHDFRPDYLRLPKALERLGRPAVMACTATATEEVAAEVVERLGLRDPLLVRSGFDRPNLSFDTVRLEGKGSKARKQRLLEIGLGGPREPPGDRLLRDPARHRGGLRLAALRRARERRLPRRHGPRRAGLRPAPLHDRRRRGGRRYQRLRHGGGQGRRALGLALGDTDQRRGLLPGGRPRRPRRPAVPRRAAGDALRPGAAGALHRAAKRRARGGRCLRRSAARGGRRRTAPCGSRTRASKRSGSRWRSPSAPAR